MVVTRNKIVGERVGDVNTIVGDEVVDVDIVASGVGVVVGHVMDNGYV